MHLRIFDVVLRVVMVHIEGLKEVKKNLVLGLLALDHVRVLLCVVKVSDVIDVNDSVLFDIEHIECLHAELLAEVIHFSADSPQELVVTDLAITIAIESFCEADALVMVQTHAHVFDGLTCFLVVKVSRLVVVPDFESAA